MPAFSDGSHAAILERDAYRCIGCGRPTNQCHHRRPRKMGGTSVDWIDDPSNGLALCGSGTQGCHGYFESERTEAIALGVIVPMGLWVPWQVGVWYGHEQLWHELKRGPMAEWSYTDRRDFLVPD